MFTKTFDGVLFIGDPHVCSKKVGRRKDDYMASVLLKLEYCAQLCCDKNLLPVILGDLLHLSADSSLKMLNRLTRVLKKFPVPPLVLEGNHDKKQTHLTEDDALALLAANDRVVLAEAEQEIGQFLVGGKPLRLWGCPDGAAIPRKLPAFEGFTIMITHHDLAFGTAYPGSKPLHEVENCDTVVNGHMHDTKPAELLGSTWWINPGNIEPISISLMAQVPKAWMWTPSTPRGVLEGFDLPHGTDLFDLNGIQVEAAEAGASVDALTGANGAAFQSKFAQLFKGQAESDAQKTDDASVLAEDLESVLATAGVSDASRQLMQALFGSLKDTAASA